MANLKLGVTIGGNVAIHSGNYNSYAPSLTGTNASGTWGISISGNSVTTSQTNFSALSVNGNAVWHAGNLTPSSYLTAETDTLASVTSRGASTAATIVAERFRGNNSLTLSSYATVNPSSNVFLYSQPNDRDAWLFLDSADTGSNWGIYHRQIDSAVSGLPGNSIGFVGGGSSTLQAYISLANGDAYFRNRLGVNTTDFSYTTTDNGSVISTISNNQVFVNGSIQLIGNSDAIVFGRGAASFMRDEEIGFGWGGGIYMADATYLRVRNNKAIYTENAVYGTVFYDVNDTNYYLDPNSNSRVARLWVDKDGDLGTYSWVGAALTTSSIEIVNSVGNSSKSPTLAFHWHGDGGPQFRLSADDANILYLESAAAGSANTATNSSTYFNSLRLIAGDSNGIYVNGNKVWHAGNDGSGSGLDADTVDGLNPSTSATANTIAVRDSSANFYANYILGTYANFSNGNSENPTIGQIWTQNTSDNYLRKSTPAHFRSQVTDGYYASTSANNTFTGKLTLTYDDAAEPFAQLELRGPTTHSGIYINPVGGAQAHIRFAADSQLRWQIRAPFQNGVDADLEIYSWSSNNSDFKFTHGGTLTIADRLVELSSIRYKESIEPIQSSLDNVLRLRPVTYNKIGKTETELGLIAEEVAEIYPEVVKYDQDGRPDGINYSRLSVVLLKAVQELTEKIKKLES